MTAAATTGVVADRRPSWRSVALPTEHGGWGLTAEPVLLGLLVAGSWSGLALGLCAVSAFLVRTPLKLVLVDRRRGRRLQRTVMAQRLAAVQLLAIAVLAVLALVAAGPGWLLPVAVAVPLIAIEMWFDVRSRSRRLVPELCGAVGIASVAASIVVAGGGELRLALAVWVVLAGRAVASIPYVRAQIQRLRHGAASTTAADAWQCGGVALAVAATLLDGDVVLGAVAVALLAGLQATSMRRSPVPPAKTIGIRQTVFGLSVVAATAINVLAAA